MKKALVTGGAGFIGSNLALELEKKRFDVTVLDNFLKGSMKNLEGFKGKMSPEFSGVQEESGAHQYGKQNPALLKHKLEDC